MGCVYMITNTINGMSYIGCTLGLASYRVDQHRRMAISNLSSLPLHSDIREFGMKNFVWISLFESENWIDLRNKEKELIVSNNTEYPNGYNQLKGWKRQVSILGETGNSHKILDNDTNIVYSSVTETSRKLGLCKDSVRSSAKEHRRICGRLFSYVDYEDS